MTKNKRSLVLMVVFAASIAGAVVFFVTMSGDKRPPPSASGYYAGPMRAKGSNHYGDDSGKEVPAPAGNAVNPQGQPNKPANQVE
ncbi:MAG: hypothetical protein JWL77_692 [Chthonomonadaceae bacterium]|nr:hypothetical protein [Chthonomonadaceae bacterium]